MPSNVVKKFADDAGVADSHSNVTISENFPTQTMSKSWRNLIRFEDKLWLVDFSGWADGSSRGEISIISEDGAEERPATSKDGNLMDVLMYGTIVDSDPA